MRHERTAPPAWPENGEISGCHGRAAAYDETLPGAVIHCIEQLSSLHKHAIENRARLGNLRVRLFGPQRELAEAVGERDSDSNGSALEALGDVINRLRAELIATSAVIDELERL